VYDLLGRLSDHDVRDEAVQAMARRYGVDAAHAAAVGDTALQLLRQAANVWQLEPKFSATLLKWAAQLHEIGLVIAHSAYQKHGEYILRNADLQGFSQTDQKLLAALVRLQRSKFSSSALEDLPALWAEPVQKLAVLFRLAVLLHRSRVPGLNPPARLAAGRRQLDLAFPKGWLAQHPLTQADLEQEAAYLKAVDIRLRFS
jgi:exopolyphosphatase/guanosine-5'-triphosphate,3'-diphosphate pyrophosphatase